MNLDAQEKVKAAKMASEDPKSAQHLPYYQIPERPAFVLVFAGKVLADKQNRKD